MLQSGYVRYEKVIILFFVLLVISAVISFLNPLELYKAYRDKKLLTNTSSVAQAIGNFNNSKNHLPWSDDFGAKSKRPGLPWTRVSSPLIGVCGDDDCTTPGELSGLLPFGFISSKVITGNPEDSIYLLKGYGEQDPIYMCFLPLSQEFRAKYQDLYKIDTKNKNVPLSPRQSSCNDNVTWSENNVCYVCIVQ
jgi:hypothetical protein